MNWSNKCVWITGASSGIGLAAAQAWSEKGANVILSSRRQTALESIVDSWSHSAQKRSFVLPLDLSDSDSMPQHVAEAIAWKGQVDVMVHCGGISQRSRAIDTKLEVDRRVMEIDYFGTVALTKADRKSVV